MVGLKIVDDSLNKSFYKLGLLVGHHPGYFLVIPILLTLLGITGFQQMKNNIDPEYLFSPINGQGKMEREIVENFFKINYTSRFDVSRITRAGRFGRVIVTSKDGNKNILRSDIWRELRLLDTLIQNITVCDEDEYFAYKDICAKWGSECFQNSILGLDEMWSADENITYIQAVESGALQLNFPVFYDLKSDLSLVAYAFYAIFGGTQVNANETISSVPSLQLVYFANVDTKKGDRRGAVWEDAFLDMIGRVQDQGLFKHIRIARFASRTLDHELEKNTRSVIPYFTSSFLIMALFSIVTCMMSDWVRSKPWLGLLGNVSAAMATMCAFGVCMYAGIDFIGINLAAPFLMVGIGIDDTFVMLAAWRRTSIKTPVPERMAQMLSEAAVSITITSVTDFFSFWIGIFSPFPSVTIFCIYSGAATVFLFVWHLTFFAACVALSGYCEKKNLHSVVCIKVQPLSKSSQRCWLYRALCVGGVDSENMDNPVDNTEHGMMVFFRDYFAPVLNTGLAKVLVLLVFAVYLLGASYGVTQIEEGLERRKVAKNDSYVIEFFDREDDYYREYPYKVQVVISGDYDYSNPHIQRQIENLTQVLENSSYIIPGYGFTQSVLRQFLVHQKINEITFKGKTEFMEALKKYLGNDNLDVKFNEAGTSIVGLRLMLQAYNISGTEHEKEMVRALRKIVRDSSLNASVFNPYFVFFDQYELVRPLSIQNMILGAIIMMIVSFIFIPNVMCSLWVAFSIISIETGVVGYMALWDVSLDSISMINLIMCIGFSVDFTAHICYAYMSSTAKTSDEKVRESLYALGMPIFQGSVSTILGMVALLLANNYIFAVFFKMVFLVVFCGAMHGLFLLPVLLSLFGPGSCSQRRHDDDVMMSNIDSVLSHPYCIPHLNGNNLKPASTEKYTKKPYKGYDMEKDLGLGTSEENSSESSSNHSKKQADGIVERRYRDAWHASPEMSQFHSSQILDIFGTNADKDHYKRVEENRRRFYSRPQIDEARRFELQRHRRRYSPPEQRHHRNQSLARSSSYHNVHPQYVQELRFP